MHWNALPPAEIQRRVHRALDRNLSYRTRTVLGLPGTLLDGEVFPALPDFAKRAWLRTATENPNHIGCHTLGSSEPAFAGTHGLEREVIAICAEQIMGAEPDTVDGYVASGGTESNIQAIWAFRNRWAREDGVSAGSIGLLCSEDTHYSVHKATDLLGLHIETVAVDTWSRALEARSVDASIERLQARGVTHIIAMLNLGTTMFGSVDEANALLGPLERRGIPFRAHVDAAFGGFIYPFTHDTTPLSFVDPRIDSVTLDAHKMLQAPYGTGIHLIRKGFLQHTTTETASYVPGLDCTLAGSRSGANAVAVWMILMTYGSEGGTAFCDALVTRTDRLCAGLDSLGIRYVRTPGMNVVAMRNEDVPAELSERYLLVADSHDDAKWRKIVVMEHVTDAQIDAFLADMSR
ncbi:MAG: aspartate aminotransferase family protein [Proteobacteria bacterium]|nr:aspartate aminotransferase family protein [Pseudomonadota bacterium]